MFIVMFNLIGNITLGECNFKIYGDLFFAVKMQKLASTLLRAKIKKISCMYKNIFVSEVTEIENISRPKKQNGRYFSQNKNKLKNEA